MAKRKYVRYQLVADFGEVVQDYESYKEAFADYQSEVGNKYPATLYGITLEGEFSVIASNG